MKSLLFFILILALGCGGQAVDLKLATYHITRLDTHIPETRKERLRTVLRTLDADIIAFQDILSRTTLESILPEGHHIGIVDAPDSVRKLALAVRHPLAISDVKLLFPEDVYNNAFPGQRDLLEARVEGYGHRFTVLVHHAKSRTGDPEQTEPQRVRAAELMVGYLTSRVRTDRVIVLGNFNDTPDDRALQILASGRIDPPQNKGPDVFLHNTTRPLSAQNHGSYGYFRHPADPGAPTFDPNAPGAGDILLFDHILVSMNLKPHVVNTGIFNQTIAIRGPDSLLTSEHIPVWSLLRF